MRSVFNKKNGPYPIEKHEIFLTVFRFMCKKTDVLLFFKVGMARGLKIKTEGIPKYYNDTIRAHQKREMLLFLIRYGSRFYKKNRNM